MLLDAKTTAFLSLDFQVGILAMYPAAEVVAERAAEATAFAREHGCALIHVGLGFSPGYPELSNLDSPFLRLKQTGMFIAGSESAAIHPALFKDGDLVVYKQRVSAFTENALEMILRARGIRQLVLFGIATSGIVLSTLRRAFDLDFRSVVLKDACWDSDAEVHRVLTEKVFARQATVTTVDALRIIPSAS